MLIEVRRSDQGLEIDLTGEWRALELAKIDAALAGVDLENAQRLSVGTKGLTALDLSGAWRLREFLNQARASGAEVQFRGTPPDQLRLIDATFRGDVPVPCKDEKETELGIEALTEAGLKEIGLYSVREWRDLMAALAFMGRVFATVGRAATSLKRLRPISVTRHVYDTGITAVPIAALIAFLISVIIAYMSAQQLRRFGAEIFVVDLVTIGVLREMGVLLTSIIVAGRSGSAFAAEIGVHETQRGGRRAECDRAWIPIEALVLPRLLGLDDCPAAADHRGRHHWPDGRSACCAGICWTSRSRSTSRG